MKHLKNIAPPSPWFKLGAVLLTTGLAAIFRLYQLQNLPPGDGYDPAFYGVDALLILDGARPVFFPTNFGREALFSYLVAVCVALWGPSALAVHLTSALVGIVTVPIVYGLTETLFSEERFWLKHYGGLVSALMVALSYWHLNWSRYGVRAILVPLFTALTVTLLWKALRSERRSTFILCGLVLGLSAYTYQAARLLPVLVVAGFVCYKLPQSKTDLAQKAHHLLLVSGVALLVFAPLGYYFLTHPGSFLQRIDQAFVVEAHQTLTDKLHALLEQGFNALLVFNFRGDTEPYSTIPGRPALNPFFSLLFFIGLGISIRRAIPQRRTPAKARATNKLPPPGKYILILTWLGLFTIPAIVAGQGPEAKRALGTLPAVAALIALGALTPIISLAKQNHKLAHSWMLCWGLVLICGMIYSGVTTYQDYFIKWAANPNLPLHFEAGISAIGDYIAELPPSERVYVSPDRPDHPGIRYHSGLRPDVRGYNGRTCLVTPAKAQSGITYIIAPSKDKHSLSKLRIYYPQGKISDEGGWIYGEPYFRAYRVPAGTEIQLAHPGAIAAWKHGIELVGYELPPAPHYAGDTLNITLHYQTQAQVPINYTAFVHLLGPENPATGSPLWTQQDSEPCQSFYPTSVWEPGEIVIDTYSLTLPAEMPPDSYTLTLGFYDLQTLIRLPLINANTETHDNVVTLGEIQLSPKETTPAP